MIRWDGDILHLFEPDDWNNLIWRAYQAQFTVRYFNVGGAVDPDSSGDEDFFTFRESKQMAPNRWIFHSTVEARHEGALLWLRMNAPS